MGTHIDLVTHEVREAVIHAWQNFVITAIMTEALHVFSAHQQGLLAPWLHGSVIDSADPAYHEAVRKVAVQFARNCVIIVPDQSVVQLESDGSITFIKVAV